MPFSAIIPSNHMTLSIIIPAYNEEDRLPSTLNKLAKYFGGRPSGLPVLKEVIVADDGSRDRTVALAEGLAPILPIRVIALGKNRGKGAAVRAGMLAATGDYALFYDADAATPVEEIAKLFAATEREKTDIAIGSRLNKDVYMSPHRRLIGRVYHAVCWPLIPGIRDAACGCKLFTRKAVQAIFPRQKINRFACDIEILALARSHGFKVAEVQVRWTAVPESKVRLVQDTLEMLKSVLLLYGRKLTGRL